MSQAYPLLVVTMGMLDTKGQAPYTLALNAAVNAWMEGHLASPGHRTLPGQGQEAPSPPWPGSDDPKLQEIITESVSRFCDGEEPALVAYAAALGWQAGRAEGAGCPGCAPPGDAGSIAQAVRSGACSVRFNVSEDSA